MPEPISVIKPSYSAGELSPSVWGRTDYKAWNIGASVFRNCFVSYRGPASSRAGLEWVGKSLTPASASSLPPKLIKFQFNIFQSYLLEFGADATGHAYMRVIANGAYVLDTAASFPVTGATQANPCVLHVPGHTFANGDWIFVDSIVGMTQLNASTYIVANAVANFVTLQSIFGIPINSLGFPAYVSGGTASKVYTTFSSPYALADLSYLKVVQSADVMTLCCVNQATGTEYPPIDLARLAANNWTFTQTTFASSILPPTNITAVTTVTSATPTQYAYLVTSVDAVTGDESVASDVAYIVNSDDIAVVAGSHIIGWSPRAGAQYYNVYQAPPSYGTAVPIGQVFAYVGSSYGSNFVNTNILADQTRTPPQHNNPFARGQIVSVGTITPTAASFVQLNTTAIINTTTGSGGVVIPVVQGSGVVAVIIQNPGQNYRTGDTVSISDLVNGGRATAPVTAGPQIGTYPSVAGYFQSRRAYAGSINNPDTLYLSQTGSYTNMDSSVPPIDSDAIVTTPWAQQVNGIQWLLPMPGGLIVATGLDAWQITGAGGAGSALTPSSQSAQPQESTGFSPTVPPLKINYDIIYNQQLGYVIRDIQYNFFNNIYAGSDISILSNQLFDGFQIVQWAWAQVPWKIIWGTRDDGRFLSLTYDKEQQLQGWARHDTNGLVQGNNVATEPPVDAPYFVVKRYIAGLQQWAYYIERMDNRLWFGPEDPRCVDAFLALPQPQPGATLTAQAAEGDGTIVGGYLAVGGIDYTAPAAQIIDPIGLGSGAAITFTVAAGVITGFAIIHAGANYSPSTYVDIIDATGAGATLVLQVSQNVEFDASASIFDSSDIGAVIRIGGGQATVQTILSPTAVLAAVTVPIVATIPDDPNLLPVPAVAGDWTMTQPVTQISNLGHLEGMQVTGLADGAVIPLTTVVGGAITLAAAASSVVVGLPFIAQLQAMPIELPQMGTIQGDRKVVSSMNVRLEKSRGVQVGANQPVASTLDFFEEIPWSNLVDLPEVPRANLPDAALPLFTGDKFASISDDWQNWNGWESAPGFVCAQQTLPLPMNILAFMPKLIVGDR